MKRYFFFLTNLFSSIYELGTIIPEQDFAKLKIGDPEIIVFETLGKGNPKHFSFVSHLRTEKRKIKYVFIGGCDIDTNTKQKENLVMCLLFFENSLLIENIIIHGKPKEQKVFKTMKLPENFLRNNTKEESFLKNIKKIKALPGYIIWSIFLNKDGVEKIMSSESTESILKLFEDQEITNEKNYQPTNTEKKE